MVECVILLHSSSLFILFGAPVLSSYRALLRPLYIVKDESMSYNNSLKSSVLLPTVHDS